MFTGYGPSHFRGCRGLFTSSPTSQAQSLLLPLLVGQARAVSVSPHASSERYSARSPLRFDTTKPFPPLPPPLALTAASNASDAPDTQHASKELANPLWPWRSPACHDAGRAHTAARRPDGSRSIVRRRLVRTCGPGRRDQGPSCSWRIRAHTRSRPNGSSAHRADEQADGGQDRAQRPGRAPPVAIGEICSTGLIAN